MPQFKNLSFGTVATAPSPAASGTSITLTSGHGARFPDAPFAMTIWPTASSPDPSNAEIVLVTSVSGDTFTIIRAQEGSSARTVVVGDQVCAALTNLIVNPYLGGYEYQAWHDDFYVNAQSPSTYGNWKATTILGSLTLAAPDSAVNHPGLLRLTTPGTATNGGGITTGDNNNVAVFQYDLTNPGWDFTIIFRLPAAATSIRFAAGLATSWTAATGLNPNGWLGVQFDTSLGHTNWQIVQRNASVSTTTDTGVAADTNWQRFRFRCVTAGKMLWSRNGGAETEITSANQPSGRMVMFVSVVTDTTAARSVDVDFVSFRSSYPLAR